MVTADRFSILFSHAFASLKRHWKVLFQGALVFGVLTAVAQMFGGTIEQGVVPTTMQLIRFLAFFFLSLVASYAGYLFVLIIATEEKKTFASVWKREQEVFFPLLGVIIWTILKSWAWLIFAAFAIMAFGVAMNSAAFSGLGFLCLFAGVVLTLIYMPRYFLAQFIFLMESKSVTESIELSYKRTKGYWGKLVGNAILLVLCMLPFFFLAFVVIFILGFMIGIVGYAGGDEVTSLAIGLAGLLGGLIMGVFSLLVQGFTSFFWRYLTHSITEHPMHA